MKTKHLSILLVTMAFGVALPCVAQTAEPFEIRRAEDIGSVAAEKPVGTDSSDQGVVPVVAVADVVACAAVDRVVPRAATDESRPFVPWRLSFAEVPTIVPGRSGGADERQAVVRTAGDPGDCG